MSRGGEFPELRQNRDPPNNAAGRVPLFAQGGHVKLDPRPKPAAHDPIDRLRFEEETLQHGNLHSRKGNKGARFLLLSRYVPPPSRDGEENQSIADDSPHNRGGHKIPTIPRSPSSSPASTTRSLTAPTVKWRPITAPQFFQHGRGVHEIRQK